MAKRSAAAAQPHGDDDRCENCGACKSCGAGGRQQFIPYPYPVYPSPYALPYRPYTSPNTARPNPYVTWGGTNLQTSSGSGYSVTHISSNGTIQ